MTDVIQRLQTAYEDYEVLSEANAFEGQNTSKVTDRTLTNKIADFGIDTGQAIVSGIEDAGVNFNQFLAEVAAAPDTLADFIGQKITDNPNFNYPGLNKETATKNIQDGLSWMDENLVPKFLRGSTKNIERKYTNQTYGNIIQGVSQFATGAVPAAKIVGLTKALPGMIAPSSAARGLTWGMIADATVIDPNAEELIAPVFRTFITNSTKDEIDTLEDTVLSILEKYDQDNDVIKRIKTANEGALIGALVEGIIAGAKALPWKTLTKALGVAGAASIAAGKKVVDTAKRVEIDDSQLGSTNIPLRLRPEETTVSEEPFYSAVEDAVNNISMEKGTGEQFFGMLQNTQGVKQEEMDWIGLTDYLKENKNVTKKDVQEYVDFNKVRLQEVTKRPGETLDDSRYVYGETVKDTEGILDWRKAYGDDYALNDILDDFDNTNIRRAIANKIELDYIEKNKTPPYNFEFPKQAVKEILDMDNTYNDLSGAVKREIEEFAIERMDNTYFSRETGMAIERLTNDTSGVTIQGNDELGWQIFGSEREANSYKNAINKDPIYSFEEAKIQADQFAREEGLADYESDIAKWEEWTAPGGTNYREVLFIKEPKKGEPYDPNKVFYGSDGGHYEEEDILAHVRLKDRTDSSGAKVLFIEEIQSDWLQQGRKLGFQKSEKEMRELGMKTEAEMQEISAKRKEARNIIENKTEGQDVSVQEKYLADTDRFVVEQDQLRASNRDKVPDAPLKKTWQETMFRRIVRMAAEEGYDKVAWTPGKMQADRYGLRRAVDKINHYRTDGGKKVSIILQGSNFRPQQRSAFDSPNRGAEIIVDRETGIIEQTDAGMRVLQELKGKNLSDVLGKDITAKILTKEGNGVIEGDDLSVGGEGMVEFYDKMIRRYADKWGKKFNSKTYVNKIDNDFDALTMNITPNMKKQVLEKGVPLFSAGAGTVTAGGIAAAKQKQEQQTQDNSI